MGSQRVTTTHYTMIARALALVVVFNAAICSVRAACDPAQCGSWDCAAWCTCYVPNVRYTACVNTLALVAAQCECSAKPAAAAPRAATSHAAAAAARPPPPTPPSSDASRCVLINAPAAGVARCLDHFGARFPLPMTAFGTLDAGANPWSCALWSLDPIAAAAGAAAAAGSGVLVAIRSGRFGRLCLTRVSAKWGSRNSADSGTGSGGGAVAQQCGTPLLASQTWTVEPSMLTAGGAAAGSIRAAAGAGAAAPCLAAPRDLCRPWVAASAELAPCAAAAAAPMQQWTCAPLPVASSSPRHPLMQPAAIAAFVGSSALAATIATCAAERALANDAIAARTHAAANALRRAGSDEEDPGRLLVSDANKLCLQPMRLVDNSVVIATHRCTGVEFTLDAAAAAPAPAAPAGTTSPRTTIPGVVWRLRRLSAPPGGARAPNAPDPLEGATHVNERTVALIQLVNAGAGPAARCLSRRPAGGEPSGLTLGLTRCSGKDDAQFWQVDDGVLGSRTVRPHSSLHWCLTADSDVANGWARLVTLQRCACTDPAQKWSSLRMEIEMHSPTSTATEAHHVQTALSSNGPFWSAWRASNPLGVAALSTLRSTDVLTAKTVPPRWLAYRTFEDVYDPVPVPYLEWLARAARSSSTTMAKAHISLYSVSKMYSNVTKPLTKVFSMALFVPAPVTPELVSIFGPVTELDAEYATKYAALAALAGSNIASAKQDMRESQFYARYVVPMVDCITYVRRTLPGWGVRIYISPELVSVVSDLLGAGNVEVAVMTTRSIRTAGAFWRWLAFDDPSLDAVVACDADEVNGETGGTIVATLWRAVEDWLAPGPNAGTAFFRWFPGWARLVRSSNSRNVQYSPIQANVILCKPKMITWSVVDTMVGFGIARVMQPSVRRFHPHGTTDVHMFSRSFDRDPTDTTTSDPMAHGIGTTAAPKVHPNLGWGRRFQEYGFDEAWSKHVLYYRATAEGSLYSAIPRRHFEAESPIDLISIGTARSDANEALRCSNMWFLDAVHQARFGRGNVVVETATSGACSPYTNAGKLVVAPCEQTPSPGQQWTKRQAVKQDIRPAAFGSSSICVTVPSEAEIATILNPPAPNALHLRPTTAVAAGKKSSAITLMRECGGYIAENEAHEQNFQIKWTSPSAGGAIMLDERRTAGTPPMCLEARSADKSVVVAPCATIPSQHWRYNPALGAYYVLSIKSLSGSSDDAFGKNAPFCLSRPVCTVEKRSFAPLRGMCDFEAIETQARANAAAGKKPQPIPLGPSASIAQLIPRLSAAVNADPAFASITGPRDGMSREALANALASFDAIRAWFANTGIHDASTMSAMKFHQGRSAFFTEITVGTHGGLVRPWTDEAISYFSQVSIQTLVSMLGRAEINRAQCSAGIAGQLARLGVGYPSASVERSAVNDVKVEALFLAKWAASGDASQTQQSIATLNNVRNAAIAFIEEIRAQVRTEMIYLPLSPTSFSRYSLTYPHTLACVLPPGSRAAN